MRLYIPIFSEIYSKTKNTKFLLTATLDIINTSMTESIFISTIDYYNSTVELVRKYLNKNINYKPLEIIYYIIEKEVVTGETNANIINIWLARLTDLKLIFQGNIISTNGQQGTSGIINKLPINPNKTKQTKICI